MIDRPPHLLAYTEELPPEGSENFGRHHCPTCNNAARYGTVVCGPCWLRIPPADRDTLAAALRLRESDPEQFRRACSTVLLAAAVARSGKRPSTQASSTYRSPESDPAPTRRTA